MTRPDPYDVLAQWLAAGFGKHGRALQGTTPTRYEADVRDRLYFTEETTGIGAWNANESTASTWAYAPALRPPNPDRPSRRPLARRVSLHNPARRLAALAAFYAYAAGAGHIPEPPFNASALRPAPTALPRAAPLTLEQAAALQYAADDILPGRHRRGPYDTAPHRDRLLVHLLLDGLRPRQAVGIDLEDLHEEDPHRRIRTLTCPAPKGDGTITHQPSREVWQAIADYLPHRVDGRAPDTGRRPPCSPAATAGAWTPTPCPDASSRPSPHGCRNSSSNRTPSPPTAWPWPPPSSSTTPSPSLFTDP
ncbi:hypothetical protein [Kitasatospora sp. NPDC058190]|uniref:hypothetical protein n=1 Tax=Kitasatospora sp. NPDC058190 TaxID=3346371 RepID=UPI0036DA68E8